MWKEVISFDNDTLIKEGLYDSKTKILDEQKFRNSTRKMMEKFEDKEGLKNNLKWGLQFITILIIFMYMLLE